LELVLVGLGIFFEGGCALPQKLECIVILAAEIIPQIKHELFDILIGDQCGGLRIFVADRNVNE